MATRDLHQTSWMEEFSTQSGRTDKLLPGLPFEKSDHRGTRSLLASQVSQDSTSSIPFCPRGWSQFQLDESGKPLLRSQLGSASLLENKRAYADLSVAMVDQINQMYAYMSQAMSQERARHSSDVALILRKIEKDLKETFRNIRETFKILTDQMMLLVSEVDQGKAAVKKVSTQNQKARMAVETQAQYVSELEAVLNGQQTGISEKIKELSAEAQFAKRAISKLELDAREKEKAMKAQLASMRERLKRYETDPTGEDDDGREFTVPVLPEMSATWTQFNQLSVPSTTISTTSDMAKEILSHSDASRKVSRIKVQVQPSPMGRISKREHPPVYGGQMERARTPRGEQQSLSGRSDPANVSSKERARMLRLYNLVKQAFPPLCVLSDVFAYMREQGCFVVKQMTLNGLEPTAAIDSTKAVHILRCLVNHMTIAAPKLRGLSETVLALHAEGIRYPPQQVDMDVAAAEAVHVGEVQRAFTLGQAEGLRQAALIPPTADAAPGDTAEEERRRTWQPGYSRSSSGFSDPHPDVPTHKNIRRLLESIDSENDTLVQPQPVSQATAGDEPSNITSHSGKTSRRPSKEDV
eukprot:TRINITY_DN42947_c0_g1_i1.p1 TRINITY_DN42947_c0_g1~~TRINITY_DN42947_c0_g1_i1.p1  ORF type:complete len:582 (+),score=104.04 TRINITY_DN42947_c0_g1_i1:96-1841(+)